MKICIDCVGSEFGLGAPVNGSIRALNEFDDIEIILCGDERLLSPFLPREAYDNRRLSVFHAPDAVTMHDSPARAIMNKPYSSMSVALDIVKSGNAQMVVSAGNTGALLSGATLVLGRIGGVLRPAMAPLLPTLTGHVILIDCGANADCKPEYLLQFAQMASIYAQEVFGIKEPCIGLVNIGEEAAKGSEAARKAYALLKEADLNFAGNAERDLLSGKYDILVTDGFTGNVLLKHTEGLSKMLFSLIKDEMTKSLKNKLAASVLKSSLSELKQRYSADGSGGALFLGVKSGVIKVHGNAGPEAFYSAAKQARRFILGGVIPRISSLMASYSHSA